MTTIKIIIYKTSTNKEPYADWENQLDIKMLAVIKSRLNRIKLGNFGDAKKLKGTNGLWELWFDIGPGYRVYFGKHERTLVVLLMGGDKKSQTSDIKKAQRYWLDYKEQI
ncbi:type II toxin-antitoxin system RelE/ParE family toxin [Candidatus Dependentiae bacterium]|nr:type II toxin-antitoxin system RelE/ParE family toxin [Candidatus Dependentiae bacterium]